MTLPKLPKEWDTAHLTGYRLDRVSIAHETSAYYKIKERFDTNPTCFGIAYCPVWFAEGSYGSGVVRVQYVSLSLGWSYCEMCTEEYPFAGLVAIGGDIYSRRGTNYLTRFIVCCNGACCSDATTLLAIMANEAGLGFEVLE